LKVGQTIINFRKYYTFIASVLPTINSLHYILPKNNTAYCFTAKNVIGKQKSQFLMLHSSTTHRMLIKTISKYQLL